jgi:hypothetical protein
VGPTVATIGRAGGETDSTPVLFVTPSRSYGRVIQLHGTFVGREEERRKRGDACVLCWYLSCDTFPQLVIDHSVTL